ncbi:Ribosome production factor 1 [Tilletia horrida]|uniref:Ribosome production factor 1 n=1 Tax=Tilletia horrida TaxID=155126 RepID=A0AAN6GHN5_9BASI|nr:Ribosome production factor 1 [Tilletia horrida]
MAKSTLRQKRKAVEQHKANKKARTERRKRGDEPKGFTRTIENTPLPKLTVIKAPSVGGAARKAGKKPALVQNEDEDDEDEEEDDEEDDDRQEESSAAAAARAASKTGDEDGEDGEENDEEGNEEEEDEDKDEDDARDDPYAPPAILITTSLPSASLSPHLASLNARSHPSERTRDFITELLSIFPGAEYRPRAKAKGAGIGKIAGWARKRAFDALLVVGQDVNQKGAEPAYLTLVQLPNGPTAFFRLTSISLGKELGGHARATPHTPELILNNFSTALGHQVGSLFRALFPQIPDLDGRQVVTAHNQRDFIFFRRHRYMFASADRASLQEIGPRFTLKLRLLRTGLPKGAGEWDGEVTFDGVHAEPDAPEPEGLGEDVGEAGGGAAAAGSAAEPADTNSGAEPSSSSSSSSSSVTAAEAKRRKKCKIVGADGQDGGEVEFKWKSRMGVNRRNFYL